MPTRIGFPYFPSPALFVAGSAVVVLLTIWLYAMVLRYPAPRVRRLLLVLRLAAIGILLFCLAHPIVRRYKSERVKKTVAVLIDRSESMSIPDVDPRGTRLRAALALAKAAAQTAGEKFRVDTYAFDSRLAQASSLAELKASGQRTDIGNALAALRVRLGDAPVAAIVLLSDGMDQGLTALPEAESWGASNVPIFTALAGGERPIRDINIIRTTTQRRVATSTRVALDVELESRGYNGVETTVELMQGQKKVGKRRVTLDGGRQHVAFEFSPEQEGLVRYRVQISPREDEWIDDNNHESFAVHSIKDKLKVLYMEGTQRRVEGRVLWEHQYLVQALEEDKDILVTTLFRDDVDAARRVGISYVRDPENGFPRTKKKLYEYDVIISSDIDIDYFTKEQLRNTVDFVAEHGGGYVMIGGYTAFGSGGYDESVIDKMLPVDMQGREDGYSEGPRDRFRWKITPEGWLHPIMQIDPDPKKNKEIWAKMPMFNGYNHVLRAKPGATVLAVHPKRRTPYGPMVILAVQQYGRGRTMAFVTDTTAGWGEQFEAEWGEGDDNRYFRKFWQNAVRWLAAYQLTVPNKPIRIWTGANRCEIGGTAEVFAEALDENYEPTQRARVWAELHTPNGMTVRKKMAPLLDLRGEYRTTFKVAELGEFEVQAEALLDGRNVGTDTALFYGDYPRGEYADLRVNRQLLKQIASRSGGQFLEQGHMEDLAARLKSATHERRTFRASCFWDNWVFYAIVISVLSLEWLLRRRMGLA